MKRLLAALLVIGAGFTVGCIPIPPPPPPPTTTTTTTTPPNVIDCGGAEHGTITLNNVDGYVIRNCRFVNAFVQLRNSTNNLIEHNTFISTDGVDHGQQLGLFFESGDVVTDNTFDAGGAYDDNIILNSVHGVQVERNTATGAWDCAIETSYDVTDTSISNNVTTGGRLCAIGGWRWSSLHRVRVDDNTLIKSATFNTLYGINFENSNGAPLPDDLVWFEGNSISGNRGLGVHVYVGHVYNETDPITFQRVIPPDDVTFADPATNTYEGNDVSFWNVYTTDG